MKLKRNRFSPLALALTLLLLLTLLSSCGSQYGFSGKEAADYVSDADYGYEAPKEGLDHGTDSSAKSAERPDVGGRKVIFSSDLTIETKSFDESCQILNQMIGRFGGYIESSNIYTGSNRSHNASYTIRVPAENYNAFLAESGTIGTVTRTVDNNQDVTDSYFDTEARLKALETKQERLLALLEQATDLDSIIQLNDALEETNYEIESLTGVLRKYDSLINYSTISIQISEVTEITVAPPVQASLGTRISSALSSSFRLTVNFLKDALVALAAALPVLILLGIIAVIVVVIVKLCIRRSRKNRVRKQAAYAQAAGYPLPQAAPVQPGWTVPQPGPAPQCETPAQPQPEPAPVSDPEPPQA